MVEYTPDADKTDGFTLKPVRVETRDNRTIEAVHHVINPREQTLGLYINDRSGGIDLKIPLSNVVVIAKSAAGAGAIDASDGDTHDRVGESEEHGELAADGGDI